MKPRFTFLYLNIFLFLMVVYGSAAAHTPNLIPYPDSYHKCCGKFRLTSEITIHTGKGNQSDVVIFSETLHKLYGTELKLSENAESSISLISDASLPVDGYILKVSRKKIEIKGNGAGIFYGLQSLLQLIEKNKKGQLLIECCVISDKPRFAWRGMHLDVCRHFFPKEFIKRYIDFLAAYKMNTFHWHLTDDQGWRIEIKKYPKLTKAGAYRSGTLKGHAGDGDESFDSLRYGGFYTQDEIKEIVRYAEQRHITIVPEIEMPGHAVAALAAYPEYSCTGGPFEVEKKWGVFDDVFCPREETFAFLKDILTEVIALFPGKYIHIGGDECPKTRWHDCPKCQSLMLSKGLKNEAELQSYFISRIDSFLTSKGRNTIGWDEILEGGLAPNAAIMSWRGTEGGIEAAHLHHKVVMTPGSYCYFDHYQGNPAGEPLAIGGYTTLEKVYSFEPVPSELKPEERQYIIGAQANLWTEYIPTVEQAEYMVFPRICALAEVQWLAPEKKDYKNFKQRLLNHFAILEKLNINYAKAIYEIHAEIAPEKNGNGIVYKLTPSLPHTRLYYTTDLSLPGINSARFCKNIPVNKSLTVKVAGFIKGKMKGNILIQPFTVTKSTGKNIKLAEEPDKRYNHGGANTLVDGVIGKLPWNGKEWIGWSGKNITADIDLGKQDSISKVIVDVLKSESSWIYLPSSISVMVSDDGKDFHPVAMLNSNEINKHGRAMVLKFNKILTRFVRIIVENKGIIPPGLPGEGNKAWLFADEISIE